MRKIASPVMSVAILALLLSAPAANANGCANKAQKLAAKNDAELLGVSDLGGGKCEAKLLLPPKNGKPGRVVTRKFNG